jgi:protein TonB
MDGDPAMSAAASGVHHGPRLVEGLEPVYPDAARRAYLEGRVIILAKIKVDGSVGSPWFVRGSHRIFAESAGKAVLTRRYTPATRNGEPIPIPFTIRIDFRFRR